MKKLLEDERNELHEQRLRVDPWHGINQDDHGDEILRNIDNLHIESHVNDSLTEHESPANTDSLSGQSVEEDMADDVDESVGEDSTKVANGKDSVMKDESSASVADSEETVPSPTLSESSSTPNKQQIATQTDPPVQREEMFPKSQYSPSPTQSTSTKQSCSHHSTSKSSSHLSNKSLSTEKSREMANSQVEIEAHRKVSASHCDAEERNKKQDEKLGSNQCLVNNR